MKSRRISILFFLVFAFYSVYNAQILTDTVKAQKFDTGKMWSFDYPPSQYFKETYGFDANESWFSDVRLSALRLRNCTSSFVSANGLMMTNHHCARTILEHIGKDGEDLIENGFFANSLSEERKIPNSYADQLVMIKDVTGEITKAMQTGIDDNEKAKNKELKIKELQEKYQYDTGLICEFVSLFNGAKFSIYGYKRYTDIRLVFAPDMSIAYFGGDFDNFTFPRYNLDCTFFRAYENDKPAETKNFFRFSLNGIQPGEPIFTIGNPGTTQRLKTIAQLEYMRDVTFRNRAFLYDNYYNELEHLKSIDPKHADEYEKIRVEIGNSQKVTESIYKGLNDPYLMARKADFQKKLQKSVSSNPELKEKYGMVWDNIEKTRAEMKKIGPEIEAFHMRPVFESNYFIMAKKLIEFAREFSRPDGKKADQSMQSKIDSTIESIYPLKFNKLLEDTKLGIQADYLRLNLGNDDALIKKMFGDKTGQEAVKYVLNNSVFSNREEMIKLAKKGSDAILDSNDPFIYYLKETEDKLPGLQSHETEIKNTEQVFDDMLGQAIFNVYGTEIPPDANFTLRISDGVLAGFDYNGTKTPLFTTFYGLYDRWYSFNKQYPWNLNHRWDKLPADFDLSTPFNFISTNDIVGGNSGSAIINKNKEVVGLAFDGNMDSIVGNFIYLPYNNRCVAVDSRALVNAIEKIYGAKRLADELKSGKIGN
jgi:hypothetical protein